MKFLSVYKTLVGKLATGEYRPGDQFPSNESLQKDFSVSRTAVNNALALLVREGRIRRVRSKGTFVLGGIGDPLLEKNKAQRFVLLGKGTLIGLATETFAIRAVNGIHDVLAKSGKSLHYIACRRIEVPEILALIGAMRPAGVLLFAMYDQDLFKGLRSRKLPTVCLDTFDRGIPFDQFTTNHQEGGILAVRKLYELGHRKIIFIGNYQEKLKRNDPDHVYWAHAAAAEASILKLPEVKIVFIRRANDERLVDDIRRVLETNKDRTGILCMGRAHVQAIRAALQNTVEQFPGMYDIVNFAFYSEREYLNDRPVWQVRWNMEEMGRQAAAKILSLAEGGPVKPAIVEMPVELY
ncbi:MAG: GntR family transcriptional regulator [Fibrobacterota bacterium]